MSVARALPLLVLSLVTVLCRAEELQPLDAEFLEYLASLESDDGDWTDVADEPAATPPCKADAKEDDGKCRKADELEDAAHTAAKKR